jgi:hypothetical protein
LQQLQQAINKKSLALQNLQTRVFHDEPGCPIKLGKCLPPPGSRWPFHFERIAPQIGRIPVTLDGPNVNHLSAWLPWPWVAADDVNFHGVLITASAVYTLVLSSFEKEIQTYALRLN